MDHTQRACDDVAAQQLPNGRTEGKSGNQQHDTADHYLVNVAGKSRGGSEDAEQTCCNRYQYGKGERVKLGRLVQIQQRDQRAYGEGGKGVSPVAAENKGLRDDETAGAEQLKLGESNE